MKVLKRIVLIVVCFAVFYILSSLLLACTNVSYRMWVEILGNITVIWIVPLSLLILGLVHLFKKDGSTDSGVMLFLKIIFGILGVVVYLYLAWWGFLVFAWITNWEERLAKGLLVVNEQEFLGANHYVYYKPVALFFRVPGELTTEVKLNYLEKKYDREFAVSDEESDMVYDVEHPDITVNVILWYGELKDDYIDEVVKKYWEEGMSVYEIDRSFNYELGANEGTKCIDVELYGEEDISAFAEEISNLLTYIADRTDLIERQHFYIGFYDNTNEELKGSIPFGEMWARDEISSDYYRSPAQVEKYIRIEYEEAKERLEKKLEKEQDYKEQLEENLEEEQEKANKLQEETDARERAAKQIFSAALAEEGYSYEVCYNAKGNLYINLGSCSAGEKGDTHQTGTYRFTLVYDRISKNDACELFVLYKEHYVEDESGINLNDTTEIVDMYAVETATGKVIVADKQAWSDLGTEEYRELTGE